MFAVTLLSAGFAIFLALKAGCRTVARTFHSLRAAKTGGAQVARIAPLAIVLFLILPRVARANESSVTESAQDDGYTITVEVGQVVLHATVRNNRGTPVSGLAGDNFQIYEDGALQQVKYFSHDDIPVEVGLIIDNSGSMRSKRAEVIAAALAFARSSNPQDQMFVVNFNENISFGLPENMPFTDQVVQLEIALSRISRMARRRCTMLLPLGSST